MPRRGVRERLAVVIFNAVTRAFRVLSALAVAAWLTGCGGAVTPRPVAPLPPQMQPRTEVTPQQRRPKLIAPPPAYGNKIVMARAAATTRGL